MKAAIVLFLSLLLVCANGQSQCVVSSTVASFGSGCSTSAGCSLTASVISSLNVSCLITALLVGVDLVIAPTGSGSLTLQLTSSNIVFNSLTITANTGVSINAIANSAINIANDLRLVGDATLTVAAGVVLNVGASVQVQAQATLNVAGNVTASTAVTVAGSIVFAGTKAKSAAQDAWVVLTNTDASASVALSGTAYVRGNGGFDASVALSGNATIAAGNSPGVIFVNGNLNMDLNSQLQIDVDSSTDFDVIIIQKQFNRNGFLYVKFGDGYRPSNGDSFTFATHNSANGEFILSHGNYFDKSFIAIRASYESRSTSFYYSSAAPLAASLLFVLLCSLLAL